MSASNVGGYTVSCCRMNKGCKGLWQIQKRTVATCFTFFGYSIAQTIARESLRFIDSRIPLKSRPAILFDTDSKFTYIACITSQLILLYRGSSIYCWVRRNEYHDRPWSHSCATPPAVLQASKQQARQGGRVQHHSRQGRYHRLGEQRLPLSALM